MRYGLLDLIFPQYCLVCAVLLTPKSTSPALCPTCAATLKPLYHYCPHCGSEHTFQHERCGQCLKVSTPVLDQLIIGYAYQTPLKEQIIAMKFAKKPHIAKLCATGIAPLIQQRPQLKNAVLIPMPTDRFRLAGRGFNPVYEIAKHLANNTGLSIARNVLIKRSFFIPQNTLNKKERTQNLSNAFFINHPPPPKVLLLDDVLTTGSTLKAAATVLKNAGTQKIYALVVAKA